MDKVLKLDDIDKEIITVSLIIIQFKGNLTNEWQNTSSLISIVWDGWSTKRRRPFSSFSIQYIHASPENPCLWTVKSHLIEFKRSIGQHTGKQQGEELVNVIRKFDFQKKVGMILAQRCYLSDSFISLDGSLVIMFRWTMWRLSMFARNWTPQARFSFQMKSVEGIISSPFIHLSILWFLSTYLFLDALNILCTSWPPISWPPSLQKSRHHVHGTNIGDEYDEELDVETNTNIEASEDDVEAVRAASITDFNPGDVVGKLMAFIAQLRMCGEDTRDYLKELAVANNCPPWEIKLWVRTRWGSLRDCFRTVLAIRKVKFSLRFQS